MAKELNNKQQFPKETVSFMSDNHTIKRFGWNFKTAVNGISIYS